MCKKFSYFDIQTKTFKPRIQMNWDYELEQKTYDLFRDTNIRWIKDRNVLIWWALQISKEQSLYPETIFLGIYLFDFILQKSSNEIPPKYYQLAMASSLWIASKFHESEFNENPKFDITIIERKCSFRYIPENFYTAEKLILQSCNWQLNVPSAYSFLCFYFKQVCQFHKQLTKEQFTFCFEYVYFFGVVHYDLMSLWYPSEIAAACFGLLFYFDSKIQSESKDLFYIFWHQILHLDQITNYSYHMIFPCVQRMLFLLQKTNSFSN